MVKEPYVLEETFDMIRGSFTLVLKRHGLASYVWTRVEPRDIDTARGKIERMQGLIDLWGF